MPSDRTAARREKLCRQLSKVGVDALLVTNETNVRYLTGFTGEESFLLIGPSVCVMISDTRFDTQLKDECPGLDTDIRRTGQTIVEATARIVKRAKAGRVGFEGCLTVAQLQGLEEHAEKTAWVRVDGQVESLRAIKDAGELAELRAAIDQAQRGFAMLRAGLVGSQSEEALAADLEQSMRRFGARGAGFEVIMAVGSNAALPHALPGSRCVNESDFLLIDWGAESRGGYRSDLTRVLVTGKVLPKLEKLHRVVLEAQQASIQAIGPGASCADVDRAGREVIENAGYRKQFGHGMGHGIGLDIHESPSLSPTSKDVLRPGMVITVEPGIYLPGWGGVRIEDDVLVTRTGYEVLTSTPRDFADCIVD